MATSGDGKGHGNQQQPDGGKTEKGGLWWSHRSLRPPSPVEDISEAISSASDSGYHSSRGEYAEPTSSSTLVQSRTSISLQADTQGCCSSCCQIHSEESKENEQQPSVRRKFCTFSFGRRKTSTGSNEKALKQEEGKKRKRSWTLKFRNPFQLLTSTEPTTEAVMCPATDSSCVCMSYTRKNEQVEKKGDRVPQESQVVALGSAIAFPFRNSWDGPRYQGAYEDWDEEDGTSRLVVDAHHMPIRSHYPRLLSGGDSTASIPSDIEVTSETRKTELMTINAEGRSVQRTVHTQVDYAHYLVPDLKKITSCAYYWGIMDRYEAERLLEGKPEGTFLLRDSAQDDFLFSVSFRRYGRSLHARIEQYKHRFSFDSHDPGVFSSPTVVGLMEHYKEPTMCMFFEPLLTIPLNRTTPFSLQHHCRAVVTSLTTYDGISKLQLPRSLKSYLKYYHYRDQVRVRRYES